MYPGFVNTAVGKSGWIGWTLKLSAYPFTVSIAQGAATTIYTAVTPGLDTEESGAGQYFQQSQVDRSVMSKVMPEECEQLWTWTEQLIAKHC